MLRIETVAPGALDCGLVCNRAGARAVTINTVGSGAQDDGVRTITIEVHSTAQYSLEVSAAAPVTPHRT